MLLCTPIDFNKVVDKSLIVTNHNPLDNKGKFTVDGIFSSRIFGNMNASYEDYSCDCSNLQGHFNKGNYCTECNTNVIYRGLTIERNGWIELGHPQISPLFYKHLSSIIGSSTLLKIIKYQAHIEGNGISIPPKVEPPYIGIGIGLLKENFDTVVDYYYKKRCKGKPSLESLYNFVKQHKEKVFCNYLPIINSRLRPAILIGGEFSFDEINVSYNMLVKNSNIIKDLTDIEKIPLNIENLAYKSQEMITDIYNKVVSNLGEKEGPIRGDLLGNRLNFTSRMVITPGDSDMAMDEVDIPYTTALEFFKPILIRRVSKLKKISIINAKYYIEANLRKYNDFLYKLMEELLKKRNIRILINRNPTIAIGSIMLLRIRKIKKDINDMTASIHNLILAPLSGDYDGDVLNFILVMSEKYINEFFKGLEPHNLLVDFDTGEFSSNFLPAKDTFLGLCTLFAK